MAEAGVSIDTSGGGRRVRFAGPLLVSALGGLRDQLGALPGSGPVTIDLAGAGAMDTAGAWLIVTLRRRLRAEGVETRVEGADAKQALLIETVEKALPTEDAAAQRPGGLVGWIGSVGEATAAAGVVAAEMTSFAGEIVAAFAATLVRPWRLRVTALVHHMQDVGLNAVPIVTLMAFLIGVVLAFMGSVQLRQFGAEVFVVDLIAITILRVLGVLMAAIIVAGRTASAYTAAIGSMKLREEIDAMRTLGLDPIEVLVLPRVLALVIMLPLLAFLANVAGLAGGALMAWIELGISPALFAARLVEASDPWNFLVGMIQAPFFAAIIGIVGCYEGMKVEKSAESLGARTSDAVVLAIFLVIVVTAAFSVFFMQVDV
ncbi:MAG: ABC transporter permease [Rhodobacteraceae bacterium]|nr:ABC transporter permease [Paracoccaceae bacterium]